MVYSEGLKTFCRNGTQKEKKPLNRFFPGLHCQGFLNVLALCNLDSIKTAKAQKHNVDSFCKSKGLTVSLQMCNDLAMQIYRILTKLGAFCCGRRGEEEIFPVLYYLHEYLFFFLNSDCYESFGENYQGDQSRTRSNLPCAPWRTHSSRSVHWSPKPHDDAKNSSAQ